MCFDMLGRSCRAESVGLRGRAGFGGGAGRVLRHTTTVRTADGALCTLLGGFVACTFVTRPDSVDVVVAHAQKRLFSGLFEGPLGATIRPQTRLKPPSTPSPTPPAPKTLCSLPPPHPTFPIDVEDFSTGRKSCWAYNLRTASCCSVATRASMAPRAPNPSARFFLHFPSSFKP